MDQNKEKRLIKKVYIGNIPYTANKDEVESLLRIVGPVINFELNYDKEAGKEKKHKGFGFCEYPDYETALSAIRNLNDLEFQSRCLKVNFETKAEQTMMGKSKVESSDFDPNSFELKNENKTLTEILASLDKTQTYFIMKELKNIKELAEPELKIMLSTNVKLSREILKMQRELGLDNIQEFEKVLDFIKITNKIYIKTKKKMKNDQIINNYIKHEKKTKIIKKTPKKSLALKLQMNSQKKDLQKFPSKLLKEKTLINESIIDPYQKYQEKLQNVSNLMEISHPFVNEPIYQQTPVNQNRMYYNVNHNLMMHPQNLGFQNEPMMNRYQQKPAVIPQNIPQQNFMRNNINNMPQQFPQANFMKMQVEKEKKWSINDGLPEKTEIYMNNKNAIMENEKIKKKINAGYFPKNFQMQQNKNITNQYHNYEEKGENESENEAEFSPIDFKLSEDLMNILMDDNKEIFPS